MTRKRRKPVQPDDERRRLDRALDLYLDDCYNDPNKPRAEVGAFARELGLSRQYVNRRFMVLFGQTVLARMRAKQLEYASLLLRTTDLSVERVGVTSAFGSPQTFVRLFGEHVGMTPGRYREQAKAADARP